MVEHVEQRGIEIVSDHERHGRPVQLFWVWAGTNLSVFTPILGALLVYMGLSIAQAIAALLIGNVAYGLLGLTSLQGPKTGTATMPISRAAFGLRGGRVMAFLNWMMNVGFEASTLVLVVLAAVALLENAGLASSTALKVIVAVGACLVQLIVPLFGYDVLVRAQRWSAYLLLPAFAVMAIAVTPKVNFSSIDSHASWATFTAGVALIVVSGGLTWAAYGSDYTRYLPASSEPRSIFWAAALGGIVPSVALGLLGIALASAVPSASDPISGLPEAFPSWIIDPYLVVVCLSLIASNQINLYSSGLSYQAVGLRVKRWIAVVIDLCLSFAVALFVLFSSSFNSAYTDFLALAVVYVAPWTAIYLVDWALRKGRYDAEALFLVGSGPYWRYHGFNLSGLIAYAAGACAALLWLSFPFTGWLFETTHQWALSIPCGMVFAGLTYYSLAARSISAQTRAIVSGREGAALAVPGRRSGENV